ncbi:MAG: TlpA family protein disulfide reductase [Clostridiaceae bacterium]|nr:TlpA family protein disulfide reductase [Clostridiaceae bacterium]
MKKIISIAICLLLLIVLTGCGVISRQQIEDKPPEEQEEIQEQQENGAQEQAEEKAEAIIGDDAPYFALKNEQGESIELEKLMDRPVVLSFWVSWNEASKEQLNIIENVHRLLGGDVVFLGIHGSSFDTLPPEEIVEYIEEKQLPFEVLLDEEGDVASQYYVGRFPTIVFLDQEGKVVQSYTTLIEEDAVLEEIEGILWQQEF